MTNKFKKGDNVKIRRDQTGGVWQVKEVKERECDKGHPETRFIYLCEEVDSKHQQWVKEERLESAFRAAVRSLFIDEKSFCSFDDFIRLGNKNWFITSTNEIKFEDEPEFKVGDWVRDRKGNAAQVFAVSLDGWMNIGGRDWVSSAHQSMVEPYEPKDNEFYWVEGNQLGAYVVCGGYYSNIIIDGCAKDLDERGFANKLHTRRPATPTEKDKLIKAVEEEYGKTYNEETKQWEDMVVEWTPQPFERVLVRDNDYYTTWNADFYSCMDENTYYCVGSSWDQVIPYKGNEALLGTTDECKTKYEIK